MMSNSTRCVHCDRPPLGPAIQLKHNNLIDATCLAEIENLVNVEGDVDEVIVQVYQHILDLVIRCSLCKATLDGTFKVAVDKNANEPLCA
jgi:hypothetical protein